jgi:hypothetical protein
MGDLIMKRFIKAASNGSNTYFSDIINEALNAGYKMKVSDNMKIILTPTDEPEIMPTISAWMIDEDGGESKYRILTKVEFPTLETEKDDDYYETERIINKWQKVGDFISYMQRSVIDTDADYED